MRKEKNDESTLSRWLTVRVADGTGSGRSTEVVWRAGPVGITRVTRPHPLRIASDELTCKPRHYLPVSTSPPAHTTSVGL
jgi:hypothetical protein